MSVVQQGPLRIEMVHRLLEAARSGDKRKLDELLGPEVSSGASMEAISIRVPEDAATQIDTSVLLGVTVEGNTALHIVASLGHLELAKEICQRKISLLTATNKMLNTPLHCAAKAGDDKMVSLLIQFAGEDENEARRVLRAINWDDSNALHEAAKYAHARVAEVLMEKDPGLASMLNGAGMSPLYLAIVTGSFDVAKVLLRHPRRETASPKFYAGPDGRTALHEAVLLNREITQEILQQKPTLGKSVDFSGRIPLHYVASGDHIVLKLLLEKDPSTAYISDAKGSFSIHIAAGEGNVLIVDQILRQCPATDELLDKKGKNFLHAAFKNKRLDVVKNIISKRPYLKKLLNDQDKKGNTPLHTAVKNRDTRSVHFLLRDKSIHLNIMNHDGFTPLDLAFRNVEGGLSFVGNASIGVFSCLALSKALFGRRRLAENRLLRPLPIARSAAPGGQFAEKLEAIPPPAGGQFAEKLEAIPPPAGGQFEEELEAEKLAEMPPAPREAELEPPAPREEMPPAPPPAELEAFEKLAEMPPELEAFEKLAAMPPAPREAEMPPAGGQFEEELEAFPPPAGGQFEEELEAFRNIGICSVLITTVTFAAGFTLPGGYIADDRASRGTAVLAKEYAFKVFIISDAFALVCSMIATMWLVTTSAADHHTRGRLLSTALVSLNLAMVGMFAAFAMGIYVVLAPSCKIISILLCFVALAGPLFVHAVSYRNYYCSLRTIAIRQGYKSLICPADMHPLVKRRLLPDFVRLRAAIRAAMLIFGTYGLFFLIAMIKY